MIRWILLAVAIAAFSNAWGVFTEFALLFAFAVLFINFATFCVLFDAPLNRARLRIADLRRKKSPHSFDAQRLQTERVKTTADDRRLGAGPTVILNLISGLAGGGLLIWGLMLRVA